MGDAGGHVRDCEGCLVPGRGRGVPREQDEFGAWLEHVRELLRALLQALRRQLLLETQGRTEESLSARGCAEFKPEGDSACHGRHGSPGRGGGDDEEVELRCERPRAGHAALAALRGCLCVFARASKWAVAADMLSCICTRMLARGKASRAYFGRLCRADSSRDRVGDRRRL